MTRAPASSVLATAPLLLLPWSVLVCIALGVVGACAPDEARTLPPGTPLVPPSARPSPDPPPAIPPNVEDAGRDAGALDAAPADATPLAADAANLGF